MSKNADKQGLFGHRRPFCCSIAYTNLMTVNSCINPWLIRSCGLLLMLLAALYSSKALSLTTIPLTPGDSYPRVSPYVAFAFEEQGEVSIDNIHDLTGWTAAGNSPINLGFGRTPLWIKMEVEASLDNDKRWWLYIPYFALNKLDLYIVQDGLVKSHQQQGFDFPFNHRGNEHRNYQFPLDIKGKAIIYLRVHASGALYVPLELWERDSIADHREKNNLLFGAYAGVILAMVIYNFFLFSAIREPVYLAYIAYVSSYFMLMMTNEGFAFQYLWPDNPNFNTESSPLFACLTGAIALDFSIRFLDVQKYSHILWLLLRAAMGICILLGGLAIAVDYDLNFIVNSLSVLFTFVIVVASIHCYQRGCEQAFYFMLAWIFLLTGIFVFASVMNGLIPSNFFTRHSLLLGSVCEVLIFSFALANRINIIKSEKLMVLQMQKQALNGLKQAELEIYEVAFKDRLTGLPNREQMTRNVNKLLASDINNDRLHLFIIHLKELQAINKTLGYKVGDDLLVKVALTLRQECEAWLSNKEIGVQFDPERDLGALEGTNFVLVVEAETDVMLEKLCQRVLALFEKPIHYGELSVDVGVCIGYSPITTKAKDFDGLLKNSQVAVEAALEKSLGFICYSEDLDPYSEKRITLMADLKSAIVQDQLDLYLQPKLDLQLQQITGFEALVRWKHPKHGFVSPVEFIPLAEKSGLINELTDWVTHKTLSYIKFFQERNLFPSISVNISARNLHQPFFAEQVVAALKRKEVDPAYVVLEITETAMMDDPNKALSCLLHLNQQGFQISLDDFGTGFSSLSYLSQLPISELKVDRTFVKDIEKQEAPVIVETTLQMAKGLGLKTVAEGIENEDALVRLQDLGCDVVQGYYIARPMPFDDLIAWLSHQVGYEALCFEAQSSESGPRS
ncbi:MAG: EAL domain-containing protein [Pseudomonadales bacterium]|nr:EAL domain-containing protein [Pseudomonadales bacterium]